MLIQCPRCVVTYTVESLSNFVRNYSDDPVDRINYSFCKCPGCESPILTSEYLEWNGATGVEWAKPKVLYPNSDFRINSVIPENIKSALEECIKCYKANSFTATVIMCRRTIEGFALEKDVKEKTLMKSIGKLKELGIINEQLEDWAQELRLVGNEAAHNIEIEFTPLDAQDALDFTIAILDFTYSFKDKFDRFKERKRERS